MQVEFIKSHPMGYRAGHIYNCTPATAKQLIEQGYAKEPGEENKVNQP